MSISEHTIDDQMLSNIKNCADEAATMLGFESPEPAADIVNALDTYVYLWQQGVHSNPNEDDDQSLMLGSLWGQQLVAELGWEWGSVTFENDDSQAVGVFSPDRSLAIYPFHFIYGCIEKETPVTILLSYSMLMDGTRIPDLPSGGYENVMDNVHYLVPRTQ